MGGSTSPHVAPVVDEVQLLEREAERRQRVHLGRTAMQEARLITGWSDRGETGQGLRPRNVEAQLLVVSVFNNQCSLNAIMNLCDREGRCLGHCCAM